ncbi:MAG: YciI family protein [Nocardioidaceae bacterium]
MLIYGDEHIWTSQSEEESRQNGEQHQAFAAFAGSAVQDGAELDETRTARSIRSDTQGQQIVTDGPFLETKEVFGSYYLLQAEDMDAAVALARRVPEASASHSGVEVRALVTNG